MPGALYFPYVSPPDSGWLNQALVYWSGVSLIVPDEARDISLANSSSKDLHAAGLLNFVAPMPGGGQLEGTFHSPWEESLIRQLQESPALPTLQHGFQNGDRMILFKSKMSTVLVARLRSIGLAAHESEELPLSDAEQLQLQDLPEPERAETERFLRNDRLPPGPLFVERNVAQLLVASLAESLADRDGLDLVTDQVATLTRACQLVYDGDEPLAIRTQRAREGLLDVSVPSFADATVSELVGFKERTAPLIQRFRQRIEDEALSIATGGLDARPALQKRAEERLADDIDEIEARMKERKWDVDRTGAIISIGTPASAYLGGLAANSTVTAVTGAALTMLSIWRNLTPARRAEQIDPQLAFAVRARQGG